MSRIRVCDLNNQIVGEFTAECNRGWMIYGNPGADGSMQTTVRVPDSVAAQKWLQLGRMVIIERPPLPTWAGVIDTPWTVTLPMELTLYGAEYLFSLRTPETSGLLTGSVSSIVNSMIGVMNEQENLYLSLGKNTDDRVSRDEPLDQRTVWDQLIPLLERTGHEMVLRPERDADNRLVLFADVGVNLGDNTGFLLDDGERGNMTVKDAKLVGKVINRVKGVSGQSTADDQLQSDVMQDAASEKTYRTRSEIISFQDVTQVTMLNDYTKTYLNALKNPFIDLTVDIKDIGNAFANLRPGNTLVAHSSRVYLPGGVHGWRGNVRILAMAYDETQNTVNARIRGIL